LMAGRHETTAGRELTAWDGQWFLGIAAGGYRNAPEWLTDANGERFAETSLAFFPGYPKVVGGLADLIGLRYSSAAFVVTLLCGVVAAYGVYRIGTLVRDGSRRAGLILVALFAASPMAVVLSMTYSEAMFCACASWVLVFLLRRQWLAAGALCGLAGLVRITAVALVLAVLVAAVVFLLRHREARVSERLAAVAAVVLAPLGVLGYLWWAGARISPGQGIVTQIGSWNELQATGWGSSFDGGAATAEYTVKALAEAQSAYDVGTVFVVLAAVVLAVGCCVNRQEWPLLAYGLGVVGMVAGSAGLMNSKARLLLPAFTLLIPVAVALARRRPATVLLVLGAAALVSGWFGAHSLLVWEYAI
ncbi:MAG: glycosyltransferase family 39 protein, partial [Thermocrispum sp.]